ncbi:MAG TPA: hypothetical protein VH107_10245 [Lacipirellulaceae bacterium]|nr:hypothetical protein [Lacipirellulaceae bacterium]
MAIALNEDQSSLGQSWQTMWHDKAPPDLVEACSTADGAAAWKHWQRHLRKRSKPADLKFLKGKTPPVLWGWPKEWQREAIQLAIETPATLAEIVIGDDGASAPDLPLSLQMIALAHSLPKLAFDLPADTWWFLAERLRTIATDALAQRIGAQSDPAEIVRNQLLGGELPLALGYLFPEIRPHHALRDDARAALSESMVELTDGQGLPDARLLPVLAPLFACWTRARLIGRHLKRGAWSRAADVQFEWLVRNAIRLADQDGAFLLSSSDPNSGWCKNLFRTALDLAGDRGDYAAAQIALPKGIAKKSGKLRSKDLPNPSLNSDWSSITIMSDGWSQRDARLAVSYGNIDPAIDISVAGDRIFSGAWKAQTTCDGAAVEPVGEWEQLCWEHGKRFDFLELGLSLTSGLRLERQILFGRADRVLYFADIVFDIERQPRNLQHSVSFPLANSILWRPEAETRDGILAGVRARAAVMPLALREWRAEPRGGSLSERESRLTLTQAANGRAICCPIFIDLDCKRSGKQRTWRQLTVGDMLEVVPSDIAVGYRIQSGDDQWLFYRSLGQPGNRTLLGHNIAGEFCAGRFVDGKFKEWIEIEPV